MCFSGGFPRICQDFLISHTKLMTIDHMLLKEESYKSVAYFLLTAPGGRVTDYRITDLNDILSGNRLAPFYGECKTSAKTPSDPIEQAQEKLTRHTLSCPLTIRSGH